MSKKGVLISETAHKAAKAAAAALGVTLQKFLDTIIFSATITEKDTAEPNE